MPFAGDNSSLAGFGGPRLIKALGHPMRTRILGMLDECIASPKELSEELGAAGAERRLPRARAGQARADRARAHDAAARRARTPLHGRALHLRAGVERPAADRPDAHLSRTQLVLDEQGRTALTQELEATIARVERIHEQAHRRLGNDDDVEPSVTLVVLRFNDAPTPTRGKATPRTRRPTTSRPPGRRRSRTT